MASSFTSQIFQAEEVSFPGDKEWLYRGGRDKFHLIPEAFKGINQASVIGWGSQGPAQSQNLWDTLAGTGIKVAVGLREGSSSFAKAMATNYFDISNGTLGEMFEMIRKSDLVILLINDAAQVEHFDAIMAAMKPGATLGFSHGFLWGWMKANGKQFRSDINVIAACPKGMGPSVRIRYVQGKETNGAGINCSIAVQQDIDGRAFDLALGWAIAIGAPFVFLTTLEKEYMSDLFGESSNLCGGVHALVESLYRFNFETRGLHPHECYKRSVESLTGPINTAISMGGFRGILDPGVNRVQLETFRRGFSHTHNAVLPVFHELYQEIKSGRLIASIIDRTKLLETYPMTKIANTPMWQVGKEVRAMRGTFEPKVDYLTAGMYIGLMVAQIDVLKLNGHKWSEICNESVIEATDSLNPFMHARGIDYLIDGCSITAQLNARQWGPRIEHVIRQIALPNFMAGRPYDEQLVTSYENHPVHEALATCLGYRPVGSIAVV